MVGGIDGEFFCRPDIDPGEIADRVVVFGVAEPPGEHGPRVASIFRSLGLTKRAYPRDDFGAQRVGWELLGLFVRHIAGLEAFEHELPVGKTGGDSGHVGVEAEVQFGLRGFLAVTRDAVGFEERLDGAMKGEFKARRSRVGWHRRRTTSDEANPNNGEGKAEGHWAGERAAPPRSLGPAKSERWTDEQIARKCHDNGR